jgi:fructokinase
MLADRYPQIKLILITMGENGSLCYETKTRSFIYAPAEPVKAVSTVGAGDSFGATFLANYMKTHDISASLTLAAKVSAFVVSRQGAIPEDMKDFLGSQIVTRYVKNEK